MAFNLHFLGGTGTVTGSKFLLEHNGKRILIDCGLFQGLKSLRLKNWDGFPVDASTIDCIVLTHAHMDHSGYIPRLIKKGFRGKIYATAATRDLCKILLPDAGHLMEEEAAYLNKTKRTKHNPALPLFTFEEGVSAIQQFVPVPLERRFEISPDLSFELRYAGHILGAASIILHVGQRKIAFTGDIGRMQDRIFHPPQLLPEIDYLVTESTYGNQLHERTDVLDQLEEIVNATYSRQGVIVVPAFAVGRAQSLMHYLTLLRKQKRIPNFPMYLNSPMATRASALLKEHKDLHRLSHEDCAEMDDAFTYVKEASESKALNEKSGPMLIISASGMCTGGRVLHHLKAFAPYEPNTILLTGFQAAGTRGEAIANKASEVKIHGEYVPIRARVANLDNVSAHADWSEILEWFSLSNIQPQKVFVTHGEPAAADGLRDKIVEKLNWDCAVPAPEEMVTLE